MLKRTRESFSKIKQRLLKKQKDVEADIVALDKDDPIMDQGLAESTEPGTDSWLADTHGRVVAVKNNMLSVLLSTKNALLKIKTGKYGKCDKCGKSIETERLEAMPTANYCIACTAKNNHS